MIRGPQRSTRTDTRCPDTTLFRSDREEVRAEVAVERIDHLGDGQVAGAVDGDAEGFPEVAQHAAPVDAAAGDVVEPLLHLGGEVVRSEEHTSELQSLMRISYAVFCLKKKNTTQSQQQ